MASSDDEWVHIGGGGGSDGGLYYSSNSDAGLDLDDYMARSDDVYLFTESEAGGDDGSEQDDDAAAGKDADDGSKEEPDNGRLQAATDVLAAPLDVNNAVNDLEAVLDAFEAAHLGRGNEGDAGLTNEEDSLLQEGMYDFGFGAFNFDLYGGGHATDAAADAAADDDGAEEDHDAAAKDAPEQNGGGDFALGGTGRSVPEAAPAAVVNAGGHATDADADACNGHGDSVNCNDEGSGVHGGPAAAAAAAAAFSGYGMGTLNTTTSQVTDKDLQAALDAIAAYCRDRCDGVYVYWVEDDSDVSDHGGPAAATEAASGNNAVSTQVPDKDLQAALDAVAAYWYPDVVYVYWDKDDSDVNDHGGPAAATDATSANNNAVSTTQVPDTDLQAAMDAFAAHGDLFVDLDDRELQAVMDAVADAYLGCGSNSPYVSDDGMQAATEAFLDAYRHSSRAGVDADLADDFLLRASMDAFADAYYGNGGASADFREHGRQAAMDAFVEAYCRPRHGGRDDLELHQAALDSFAAAYNNLMKDDAARAGFDDRVLGPFMEEVKDAYVAQYIGFRDDVHAADIDRGVQAAMDYILDNDHRYYSGGQGGKGGYGGDAGYVNNGNGNGGGGGRAAAARGSAGAAHNYHSGLQGTGGYGYVENSGNGGGGSPAAAAGGSASGLQGTCGYRYVNNGGNGGGGRAAAAGGSSGSAAPNSYCNGADAMNAEACTGGGYGYGSDGYNYNYNGDLFASYDGYYGRYSPRPAYSSGGGSAAYGYGSQQRPDQSYPPPFSAEYDHYMRIALHARARALAALNDAFQLRFRQPCTRCCGLGYEL